MVNPLQAYDGFVFIVTYGRSGSTLIQTLLNTIPGYCIRGENNNALAPLALSWNFIAESSHIKGAQNDGFSTGPTEPWYGAEAVKADAYGTSLANCFCEEILAPPQGTRVTGFKEIRWCEIPKTFDTQMQFLTTFFPNAKIIFNTRDHADVRKSGWWANMRPDRVMTMLNNMERQFEAFMNARPEICAHVHHSDYITDHDALRPMYDLIGEPFDADHVRDVLSTQLTH